MATRINRSFEVTANGTTYTFTDKARSEVDGMGTRIINHDGTIAFSRSGHDITVVETGNEEVEFEDPTTPEA